jgi:uncharacterized protein
MAAQLAVLLTRASRLVSPKPSQAAAIGLLTLTVYALGVASVLSTDHCAWIFLSIFLAALVSSIGGFAFSAICGAMLFHLVDEPARAVQIMMICSAGGQAMMVWALRREIQWGSLWIYLAGAMPGLPLGLLILLHSNPTLYARAVGVLLLCYALFMIVRPPLVIRQQHPAVDAVVGFLGGITGGAAAFPGAFITVWCGFKGWTKEQQRGLYQPFILIVQLAAITLLTAAHPAGPSPISFDFYSIAYLPAMLLGSSFGLTFFRRLNDQQFTRVVNLLLVASGLSLIV